MILVTGGGGYLGTVLVRRLLADRHRVVVLDRFSWGTQPLASVALPGTSLTVLAGDLRSPQHVATALSGVAAVIHLAGVVGYPACDADPTDADTTNVEGTRLLCQQLEGRPILFASTGSTYGKVAGTATEATPLSPLTRYGRTKAEAERIVLDAGGTVLRLATLFGVSPRMRWDLLPHAFARAAVRDRAVRVYDPEARRTFLQVEDAAGAFAHFLTGGWRGTPDPGVYNIGVPTLNLTKGQVAETVHHLTGCAVTTTAGHDPDERDYAVCTKKVHATGWRAEHPGLDLTDVVQWARVWREGRPV